MAVGGQEILYFMSVGVSSTPTPDQSFEELRIHDYIKAYQSTRRAPQPCPQSPDTPNARAALGLAPLFVPTAIPVPGDSLNGTISDAPPTNPTDLPTNHEFRLNKSKINNESFQSISAQTFYSHFAHEELRCYAYLAGNKMPPPPPIGETSASPVARSTTYMISSAISGGTPDHFMSIVASHKFEKHSFEELRIAYLLAGKEVGSSEIPTRGALPAQSAPTLFGRPRGDAFSSGSLKLL
ncbi:hypothetical protein V8E55_009088 [Tylopilus felleus]